MGKSISKQLEHNLRLLFISITDVSSEILSTQFVTFLWLNINIFQMLRTVDSKKIYLFVIRYLCVFVV